MPTLALLLAPLLLSGTGAPLRASAPHAGPIRSLCLPPEDSATTPRIVIGAASFRVPAGFSLVNNSGELKWFENTQRYFGITSNANPEFPASSDMMGRVSCNAVINGRSVTVTTGTIELEHSRSLQGPGVIGMQNIAVVQWDQQVSGHILMALAIARNAEDLEMLRPAIFSVRVVGDSVAPSMTLEQLIPHWVAVRVDTIAGLELETQSMGGSARFVARSVGGDVAVTSPELEPDSVRAWSDNVQSLAETPAPGVHPLGSSVAATATNIGGKRAVAVSFAEETSDAQVALALTPSDAERLAGALRAAMDAVSPRAH
jgi:hypothetical protein